MNLAKWAYDQVSDSSQFRNSDLWKQINPLVYSALFPKQQPADAEDKVNAAVDLKKTNAEIAANTNLNAVKPISTGGAEIDDITKGIAEDPSSLDKLSTVPALDFDDLAIEYTIAFLE